MQPSRDRQISVVIPTLQKSDKLTPLVQMYSEHPMVSEIIIINNAQQPLGVRDLPKVKVSQQSENIYVNPAWNLGASLSTSDILLISNDDILVSPSTVTAMARALRWPIGMVGMDASCVHLERDHKPWFIPAPTRNPGYGTLMALRRSDYHPIPDDLLIWFGDDWLFHKQRRLNWAIRGVRLDTKMSETVRTPGLDEVWGGDTQRYAAYRDELATGRFSLLGWFMRTARTVWSGMRVQRLKRVGPRRASQIGDV